MDSYSIINDTSFSPDKSETAKSTLDESFPSTFDEPFPSILDFENFEAIKAALEAATTYQEQMELSYVLPLQYDIASQRYVLVPNAEDIYHHMMDKIKNSRPPHNPVSPLMQWWEGKKMAERNSELLHSMQIYWLTVASSLNEVKDNLMFGKSSKEQINTVTDAIATAHLCADWYMATLHEKYRLNLQYINNICYDHYCHNENVFYNKLESLIKDPEIYSYLQNKVQESISYGTRYFSHFLFVLGIKS
jgi:hypothetical protein